LLRNCSRITLALIAIQSPNAYAMQEQGPPSSPPATAALRWTQLQLPLVRNGQLNGDIIAEVTPDGQIRYERASLLDRLAVYLAPPARDTLAASLGDAALLTPEQIEAAGVVLRYNPGLLEVTVERIAPNLAAVQTLGSVITESRVPVTQQPQDFSAYVNVVGDFRLEDFETFEDPGILVFGAARFRGFVAEFDGGYDRTLTGGKGGFYRRSARLVYDEIDKLRRWSAGDLQLSGIPVMSGALLGGVAVEKGRRVFSGAGPVTQLGSQQILLDRDATVEVIVDGQQVQTLQLAAGPYDLSQLTAQYGGRNAQLFVTDVTGRRQVAAFDPFYDPVDLGAGEDEYSAGVGFVARAFEASPKYGGLPAFSGFYRRGVNNRLLLGGALQLSEDLQVAGAEMVISPQKIPGRFELSGAISTGDDFGYSLRGAYNLQLGTGTQGRQFSISADYRSARFQTLTDVLAGGRFETLNVTANYAQSIGEQTTLVAGVNWFHRPGFSSSHTVYTDIIHRTRDYRVTAGVEYGKGLNENQFGVRLGLTVPFGRRTRGDVNYNSRRETARAFVTRSYEDRVGSFGYDVGIRRSATDATVDAIANYVGNRFYARGTIATGGPDIGQLDQRQQARLQIGTSIAFAGGDVAIGRPISDSFVIAKPHESAESGQVVLGRSVQDKRFDALSGALGPALGSRLQSYSRQNVIYDLINGPAGYDIGSGIDTVEPPYRSGYNITVGSDANVTAFGVLTIEGAPASLIAGSISSPDDDEFANQPFFTNSVGRFAIMGLRPGKTYQVRLNEPGGGYTISVPANSQPLYKLGEIVITPPAAK
jgi:outer membrane usher protein